MNETFQFIIGQFKILFFNIKGSLYKETRVGNWEDVRRAGSSVYPD